jgi:hypothetical protein
LGLNVCLETFKLNSFEIKPDLIKSIFVKLIPEHFWISSSGSVYFLRIFLVFIFKVDVNVKFPTKRDKRFM